MFPDIFEFDSVFLLLIITLSGHSGLAWQYPTQEGGPRPVAIRLLAKAEQSGVGVGEREELAIRVSIAMKESPLSGKTFGKSVTDNVFAV